MKMLLAGGLAASAGSLVLGRATAALAATPVKGGNLKGAGFIIDRRSSTRPRPRCRRTMSAAAPSTTG